MSDNSLDSFVSPQHRTSASASHLLVAITFHFVQGRLGYLEKVLQSLASFPVQRRDIVVFTNTTDRTEQKAIHQIFHAAGLVNGHDARLEIAQVLAHPYELTWAHKKLISEFFLTPGRPYSHFIYLEDDEQLTFENFAYFLAGREILHPFGLIPGFMRIEWDAGRECQVSVDNIGSINLGIRPLISNSTYAFIEADSPYCGMFILDRELAREYVASRSFDLKHSREVSGWNVRERAAMGLTFENPPAPFVCRVVIPVSVASRSIPECARLAHLPNSYVSNSKTPFGKIAMTKLFADNFDVASLTRENSTYRLHTVKQYSMKNIFERLFRFCSIRKMKTKIIFKCLFGPYG